MVPRNSHENSLFFINISYESNFAIVFSCSVTHCVMWVRLHACAIIEVQFNGLPGSTSSRENRLTPRDISAARVFSPLTANINTSIPF